MTKRLTGTRSIMASADDVYRMLTSSGPASSPCVGVPGGRSAWLAFVGYRLHGWVYLMLLRVRSCTDPPFRDSALD